MEEAKLVTEGGYTYIVNEEGLKIRNSTATHRLRNDSETYPEYKLRRKMLKEHIGTKLKGNYLWPSLKRPSKELQIKVALNTPGVLESDEFLDHKRNNLGTYNKAEVKAFIDSRKDG